VVARIRSAEATAWREPGPGVRVRPLIEEAGTSLMLYRIAPGTRFELHAHPFPELGLVLSGRGYLTAEDGERAVSAGDSYFFPADAPHGFWVPPEGEEVVLVDVSAALGTTLTPALAESLLRVARAESVVLTRRSARRRGDA
jgi:quercetin dioxygenase-like cupin family protein